MHAARQRGAGYYIVRKINSFRQWLPDDVVAGKLRGGAPTDEKKRRFFEPEK